MKEARPTRHIVTSEGQLFLMTASDPRFSRTHKHVALAQDMRQKVIVNGATSQLYLGDNGRVYAVAYDWSACEMRPIGYVRGQSCIFTTIDGSVCAPATTSVRLTALKRTGERNGVPRQH
jgi:hypothetical protein